MQYSMRKQERQLGMEDADRILREGEYGVLSTCAMDGEPYGVPLSYVYQNGILYFHCAPGVGHKVVNLDQNPHACFTVVGKTEVLPEQFSTRYESTIVFGICRQVNDLEEKEGALRALVDKYSPQHREQGEAYIQRASSKVAVYRFVIEHMSAKGRR